MQAKRVGSILIGGFAVLVVAISVRAVEIAPESSVTAKPTVSIESKLTQAAVKVGEVSARLTQAAEKAVTVQAQLTQAAENKVRLQEEAQQRLAAICADVETRIALNITRYDNNQARHIQNYNRLKEKVQEKITKLAGLGVDVTKLNTDLTVLDGKIQLFATDYAAFIAVLRESQTFVCGKSEGEFRAKLENSRTLLAKVKSDALDIRLYYQETIRPDIEAVRNLVPTPTHATRPFVTVSPEGIQ